MDSEQTNDQKPKVRNIKDERFCCGLMCKATRIINILRSDNSLQYDENDWKACHSKLDKVHRDPDLAEKTDS
jgi:hypothetical protein